MADTFTTKLHLLKPDPTDAYDVGVYSGSMDTIDANMGTVLCTAATHPSSPWTGMAIQETDTGNRYVYNSGQWYSQGGMFTSATRPNFVLNGSKIYESDTGNEYVRVLSNWVCTRGSFASTARPANAAVGCQIWQTDTFTEVLWNGTAWVPVSPYRVGSCQYVNASAGSVTSEILLASFTTTLYAGHKYRITLSGVMLVSGSGTSGWYLARFAAGATVTTAGTSVAITQFDLSSSGFNNDRSRQVEFTSPGAGTYTFGLFAARAAGTGTCTLNNNGTQPDLLVLDDVGA